MRFRTAAVAATVAMAAVTASAQVVPGWTHEAASGVEFAFFTRAQQELTVRCKGRDVEVVYYIDAAALDPALRGLSNAVFAVVIDDSPELRWTDSRLVIDAGIVSVGIGGKPASDLAHDIAGAKASVVVSVLTGPPAADSVQYDRVPFPIYGAGDAIKAAYAGCGIPF
jgi:hypothetical protein